MSRIVSLIHKVSNRLTRLRLQPIQVFCLHHVCQQENPLLVCKGDWISEESFIKTILLMRKRGYKFISLSQAWSKINNNLFRFHKYVVLTFDDGYRSSLPTFHWLEEQGIPYVLFLNAKYFDGVSASPHIIYHAQSVNPMLTETCISHDLYLSDYDLHELSPHYSEFGSHGFEHLDATCLQPEEFKKQVQYGLGSLKKYSQFIPFYAYTWGHHTIETDQLLKEQGLIAVLMDGGKNYASTAFIHRELFPTID